MILNKENWCVLPTVFGDFRMYDTQDEYIRILSYSPIENIGDNPLLRMHSSCIASEVFSAKDCDCADQLHEAMKLIANEGKGLIFHIHQEGRGHGLSKKIKAVSIMQKENCDTAESFVRLGLKQDIRDFTKPVEILKSLGITSVRLISNNPYKVNFLTNNDIAVEVVHTHPKIRKENRDYLFSKNAKLGHTLPLNEEETTGVIYFYHSDQMWGEFANFSKHAIYLNGKIWATVEHFYQAQKFHNTEFEEVIRQAETPTLAKQQAYEFLKKHPVPNWVDIKENVMYRGLEAKFSQHPDLVKLLISTKNKTLVERADFDNFWGDGKDGKGKNRLGYLLMRLRRQKLKEAQTSSNHESIISNYWNIETPLRELGKGDEGIVFTDEKWVYKSFYDITDKEWKFLKEKSACFADCPTLTKIECYEDENHRFIRYPYLDFEPLKNFDEKEIISFLKFCKANDVMFANIKPLNFIQTQSGIKFIDYGRSFIQYTDGELLNATKRTYLLWKFPTMENNVFKTFTLKINNGEEFAEISGWERFWNEVKPCQE
jgi:GTP cyclohydrolase II